MPATPSLNSLSVLGAKRSNLFSGAIKSRTGVFVRGASVLLARLDRLDKIMPLKSLDGISKALLIVEAEAVRLISRGYYRPAVDTGHMRRSVTHTISRFDSNIVEGFVGLNVNYAIYVHEGTINMEKRPFLVDALANTRMQVQAILVDTFKNGLST